MRSLRRLRWRAVPAALLAAAFALVAASLGAQAPDTARDSLAERLEALDADPDLDLPALGEIGFGARMIPEDSVIRGSVATFGGPLDVYGTITGDAIAIDGDVIVHNAAKVGGRAIAFGGEVRVRGGSVIGGMRSVREAERAAPAPVLSPVEATTRAVGVTLGWFIVLAIIGIGVLMFASESLEEVSGALQTRFSRVFWIGLLAEVAIAPALFVLIVALGITVIGLLLIPFAVVAYALVVAGVLTLAFLAAVRVVGAALHRGRPRGERGERRALLGSLTQGLLVFVVLWMIAAAFTWSPIIGGVLRGIAAIVTWVAVTAGLGAVVVTRAGTKRDEPEPEPEEQDELSWQTPTPVTGIVAARRPTPIAGSMRQR